MKITEQLKGGNLRCVLRKFFLGNFLSRDLLKDVSLLPLSISHKGSKILYTKIPDKSCGNRTVKLDTYF